MTSRPHAAVVLLAAAAGIAQADVVDMHFSRLGQGEHVQLTLGSRTINSFAGQLIHDVTQTDPAWGDLLGEQAFFCTDLFQGTSSSTLAYTLTGLTDVPDSQPMSAATASAVESLFASADQAQFAADAPDDLAAAFQLALWEVVADYDDELGRSSLDLSNGWFRASAPSNGPLSNSVLARLNTLFDAVDAGESFGGQVHALRSPAAQDQLFAVAGIPASVPTPGSLASFAAGMMLAAGRRRR